MMSGTQIVAAMTPELAKIVPAVGDIISAILPVAIGVAGLVLVVRLGLHLFKSLARG